MPSGQKPLGTSQAKKTHLEKAKSIIHVNKRNKSISLRIHDTNIFRCAPAARVRNDVISKTCISCWYQSMLMIG